MTIKPDPLLFAYAQDTCRILATSLELARRSRPAFYRVCAAQLRLLLCDTTRQHGEVVNVSLLPRLYPDISLRPLKQAGSPKNGLFDLQQAPIPLADWLQQRLDLEFIIHAQTGSRDEWTIRHLIRQVCDHDGGAHVDPRPNSGLAELVDYPQWVIVIGEYVFEEINDLLK
jgi:hypothetical protein